MFSTSNKKMTAFFEDWPSHDFVWTLLSFARHKISSIRILYMKDTYVLNGIAGIFERATVEMT